jgi:hypothetical protein
VNNFFLKKQPVQTFESTRINHSPGCKKLRTCSMEKRIFWRTRLLASFLCCLFILLMLWTTWVKANFLNVLFPSVWSSIYNASVFTNINHLQTHYVNQIHEIRK